MGAAFTDGRELRCRLTACTSASYTWRRSLGEIPRMLAHVGGSSMLSPLSASIIHWTVMSEENEPFAKMDLINGTADRHIKMAGLTGSHTRNLNDSFWSRNSQKLGTSSFNVGSLTGEITSCRTQSDDGRLSAIQRLSFHARDQRRRRRRYGLS